MITVAPRFDRQTLAAQFAARTRLELGRALRGPFLPVLLLLGLANTFGTLASVPPDAPLAATMARVDDAFRLVPIVVATFWAGELVWGEHDLGLDQIVGASPVPGAALILPKIATLLLILAGSLGTVSLVAAGLEGWRAAGWHIGAWPTGSWLAGFALPRAWDAGLLAILAVFLQAVSPGKLAGFGLMILYLISALALETMGFHGDLYRYGGASTSLALGEATSPHALLVRAYWSAAALLLTMLSCRLAGRGVAEPFGRRLIRVRRSSGGEILGLVAAAALTLVLGILLSLGAHLGP
jgi:ABC-2 type transport system permease protein